MTNFVLSSKNDGRLKCINFDNMSVAFNEELGPRFYIENQDGKNYVDLHKSNNGFEGILNNIKFTLNFVDNNDYGTIYTRIENIGNEDFCGKSLGIKLGIDTYMVSYPQWNDIFFPTMLRCENTHFFGYFMTPQGKIMSLVSKSPIASYSYDYNKEGDSYGHRIHTVNFDYLKTANMPNDRYPNTPCKLAKGEVFERSFYVMAVDNLDNYYNKIYQTFDLPFIIANKYTVEKGEEIKVNMLSKAPYKLEITDPTGNIVNNIANEVGVYSIKATTDDGYICNSYIYCRSSLDWYMNKAREQAIINPPHATTHTESWYGFFSGYLASKHYPNEKLDKKLDQMFEEIMPYMYDFENVKALVIPVRVQNLALLVSLLVDRYESNPTKNEKSLDDAIRFAELILNTQKKDGAYYRNNTHYTCVIYIAKSMLELWYAEKDIPKYKDVADKHYNSVKMAIDNLVEKLDNIETEGEMTFEDGMISCASLQIGMFALTLPENKREPYVKAAKYMDEIHSCLENKIVPDCRMKGGSLRFWEAKYDVMIKSNLMSSPHGWTAWTMYAKYYLYLLTNEVKYLKELMDGMGACIQLINNEGKLRWAFVTDPYVETEIFVPDTSNEIKDGYNSIDLKTKAYRGKHIKCVVGEQYIDMISGWFRTGEQKVTGGFLECPLVAWDGVFNVDKQGGTCDNDVHEIFKCMEETILKKAYVAEDNGKIISYNCKVIIKDNKINISAENIEQIHLNLKNKYEVFLNGKPINLKDYNNKMMTI